MVAPVTRAHGGGLVPLRRCRRGEGFEGQRVRRGEARFATGRNTANPRIGSRAKQTCTVGEEKPSRWCETTRTARGRDWLSLPEGSRGDAEPRRRTLRLGRWRGDLWTTPGEAVRPAGRTAWIGTRRESRRQGQEGRAHVLSHVAHSGRRDLEDHDASSRRRSRRGAAKPTAAESTGELPPWKAPVGRGERRATVRGARARPYCGEGVACHVRGPVERGGERSDPRRP
jgi:hypothetical protein